ncbi:heparan-alpha-glucosaminide N-acetyltransferase domain-containing protein [Deinococcus pimensis]|uniref:heparan-alpha-glucosaminide N-acetyltransferase domain-containing protein n=1 Tax=Deinococcus pimensis TaxID=309888 RepID=UPI000483A1A3|nr:heparan-alpha-glucosaminide N-acetyltransferase domain-containing protein [Deinococcus pimensis]
MAAPTVHPDARPVTEARAPTSRLVALDAWRGLTVLLMLLVNNVALDWRTPRQLLHAPWGGSLSLADLVFPWFLFCAGVAVPFSAASARRAGITGARLVGKLLSRTVLLFLVGCLLTSAVSHRLVIGLGVLQLIALASLVGGLTAGWPIWWRVGLALALLLGYDGLIRFTPLPDGSVGVFEEGRNVIDHLNGAILAPLGLRGLPSVVPTAALVVLGGVVGDIVRRARDRVNGGPSTTRLLLVTGVLMTLTGWAWSFALEFNKPVWTPSYILFSAGLATIGILALYSVADAHGYGRWFAPLTWAGRNALFAYVAPILVKTWILQDWTVTWTGKSQSIQQSLLTLARTDLGLWWGGWLYTLGYIGVVWLALWWMARRNLVWKF